MSLQDLIKVEKTKLQIMAERAINGDEEVLEYLQFDEMNVVGSDFRTVTWEMLSLQNRRDFLRKQRRTRGEREARVAREGRSAKKSQGLFSAPPLAREGERKAQFNQTQAYPITRCFPLKSRTKHEAGNISHESFCDSINDV